MLFAVFVVQTGDNPRHKQAAPVMRVMRAIRSPREVFAQHALQLGLQVDALPTPARHEVHHQYCEPTAFAVDYPAKTARQLYCNDHLSVVNKQLDRMHDIVLKWRTVVAVERRLELLLCRHLQERCAQSLTFQDSGISLRFLRKACIMAP